MICDSTIFSFLLVQSKIAAIYIKFAILLFLSYQMRTRSGCSKGFPASLQESAFMKKKEGKNKVSNPRSVGEGKRHGKSKKSNVESMSESETTLAL